MVALRQAEAIFQLGEALPELARTAAQSPSVRLVVGIADGLPKLEVQRLLRPVLQVQGLRLVCLEGEMPDLLAELAVHKLDVVLSDHPAPFNPRLKVHNHPLGTSAMGWYAAPQWWAQAADGFPASLQLLPCCCPPRTPLCAARLTSGWPRRDCVHAWWASLKTTHCWRLLAAPAWGVSRCGGGAGRIAAALPGAPGGRLRWVEEHYYAISTERKVAHPLVQLLLQRPREAESSA